jgi:pimeloyl-ACP methyl ester carboxylesterase
LEPNPGPFTFVLVPGAGGQAWYWHRVVQELEARAHTVLAVDLPADDDTADLDAYAATIVDTAAGHDRIVLVAQSMGGFSAPLVCDRLPVSLLVLVNAMIPLPGETGHAWWTATGQAQAARELAAEQGRPAPRGLDVMEYFFHDVPAEIVEAAIQAGEPEQSETPFTQPFPLSDWPAVPTRVVASLDDRLFPRAFQRRVAIERLGIEPDEVPGGHLVALAQPVALADRLEAYAAEVVGSGVVPDS